MPTTCGGPLAEPLLILVRHGETAWNAERRFTTRTDVPMSAAGVAQAAQAAAALAGVALRRIYASPLQRARRTAEAVAAAQSGPAPPVAVDERLTEIDAGPFEGLTVAEIEAGPNAAAYRAWHTDSEPSEPPGTEPLGAAAARARAFLADVAGLPGTTLAVTHGSLVRVLVAACVLGAHPAAHRRLWLDNGRCAVIETGDGRLRLTAFNVAGPGAA